MEWAPFVDVGFAVRMTIAAGGGLATGFVGGMVGLALGRPRLLLVYWIANSPVNAAGTNILISTLASATGSWQHLREGRVDLGVLHLMGVPSAAGAFLGGIFISGWAPRTALLVLVGILTTWYGFTLLTGRRGSRRQGDASPPSEATNTSSSAGPALLRHTIPLRRRLLEVGLGLGIGILGGTVGLVLGQLRLPAMIDALHMDPRIAAGTSLTIGTITGISGFLGHLLNLQVDLYVLSILGTASILGSYLGARQTGKVSRQTLEQWLGAVMLLTSLPLFWLAYSQL